MVLFRVWIEFGFELCIIKIAYNILLNATFITIIMKQYIIRQTIMISEKQAEVLSGIYAQHQRTKRYSKSVMARDLSSLMIWLKLLITLKTKAVSDGLQPKRDGHCK